MNRFLSNVLALTALASAVLCTPAMAQTTVWGVQSSTGKILKIDPLTGAVLGSFATPAPIAAAADHVGLTIAEGGTSLLYINTDVSTNLYRLNPNTGAILSTVFGDNFQNHGLSYEKIGGSDFIYYSHLSSDTHRQSGFGGTTTFFWGPGAPTGGLGGDGNGREFGIYSDGLIHEFNPSVNQTTFLSTLPEPSAGLEGLAFDGTFLYASNSAGQLFTLNPNTGAVLHTVTVGGGTLVELGAAVTGSTGVPEPGALGLCTGLAVTSLFVVIRRIRRR